MKLTLNNIGILKKAEVKFNGLTVIAGENDSGKSTIGKVLYGLLKTIIKMSNRGGDAPSGGWYRHEFQNYIHNLFKNQISKNGSIEFNYDNTIFNISVSNNRCIDFNCSDSTYKNFESQLDKPLLVETPYIWNIFSSIKTINNLENQGSEIDFEVATTLQDLYFALTTKLKENSKTIKENLNNIIRGEFQENALGNYVFKKDDEYIELINLAMGIKYIGILQVLFDKNHLYDGQILILDEPEVHLHPKWQLELAKIIVYLVKNGVKIVVNSHSPYMIEALQRYADNEKVKSNFYFADEGNIIEDEESLSKIFAKLSEPFDEFDALDKKALHG